jgi:hypothetical protein
MNPLNEKVTYFAKTDFRNKQTKFGIKHRDRSRHMYIIGKTGMGKSTVLENLAAQDILNNEGMCFVDPHGSAIDTLIEYVPEHRVKDVVYFAPFDTDYPISFNVMENVDADKRHLVVNGLMASFKKIWQDAWSARMEYILSNTLLALLEYPGSTLLGVNRMLAEKDYRLEVVKHITDASVRAFWEDEYAKWDPRYAREAGAAIQNKIGQFTANPLIRNIIGQPESSFNIREMMDNKKILLINLSKGRIGEQNANLLGGMLITKLYLAAMSRAEVGAGELQALPDFFLYVDEFQNFANESFADILSEARKYKLNLTIAHQYVAQMPDEVREAVIGNVGTMVVFRVGPEDAELFERQFAPVFSAEDIVNLGKFQVYMSLMIDGVGSRPFSARTLPPVSLPPVSLRDKVIEASRSQFAQPRDGVQKTIDAWYAQSFGSKKDSKKSSGKNENKKSVRSISNPGSYQKRDKDTPFKKALKELDEKEAELEMKQVVSPKLNTLLGKLEDQKKGLKAQTSTKEKRTAKKTANTTSKSETDSSSEKSRERKANTKTQSDLKSVLAKALAGNKSKGKTSKQTKQKPAKGKTSPLDILENTTHEKPEEKDQSTPSQDQPSTKQKEVPEDVLRNMLS